MLTLAINVKTLRNENADHFLLPLDSVFSHDTYGYFGKLRWLDIKRFLTIIIRQSHHIICPHALVVVEGPDAKERSFTQSG